MSRTPRMILVAVALTIFAAGMLASVIIATAVGATSSSYTVSIPTDTEPAPDDLAARVAALERRIIEQDAKIHELRVDKRHALKARAKWRHKARRLHRLLHPYSKSWLAAALCVHSKEGSWTDPNPPYFGGMQMDLSFQRAYGGRFLRALGTADHWHPKQQLLAAFIGYRARGGWNPWPNTARACGLPLFA